MAVKTLMFLCSGGGGTLRFIARAIELGWLPNCICMAVVTDRPCPAGDFARRERLPLHYFDFDDTGQAELYDLVEGLKPDIVITTIHRKLNDALVTKLRGRIINLHYSLLPAFSGTIGTKTVKAALHHGVCLAGVTVHHVSFELDAGRPITQIAFPVVRNDDLRSLMEIEFRAGCIALLNAILLLSKDAVCETFTEVITIKDRTGLSSPPLTLGASEFDEEFWFSLK